ncbi:DUF4389 domain-containing protein [Paractinoplanes rishiriensis]|uniref:DUF4389 domain-containing protein n=1 Tax=Paractinoplanes rishiriensis TaxID=1050105 RepID=A0A919N1Q2_9ACTN|nr:DUF4389 domain-containing protein [Actinoplanes rishiriensis]GIF02051.1 hypothetical protein Ari01nite_95150 [Actinoplanes rishiriensis]
MNRYPLRVEAHRDEKLSRWLWLVKWLLLVPHYLALLVLWTGVVVVTVVAYLAVLFTGRYPASIRAYNLGVLRWTWRVGYYGYQALGTDRYPPFTLADVPDYPARLHLGADAPPPRWLPLVAWLFAIPHLIILGALTAAYDGGDGRLVVPISVMGAALLVAGFALLFTGRYPGGLHDLLAGIARWNLRVAAYLMLLTPRYPPFRLDQGGADPDPGPGDPPATVAPTAARASAAGPVTALVAGVLLLAPAAGLGTGGAVLLALEAGRDSTGYVTSPAVQLTTSTAAVTAEHLAVVDADLWARNLADVGGVRIVASTRGDRAVFVGIAEQRAVDEWLAGTAHDELVGLTAGTSDYQRAAGGLRAVGDPADQPFWLASATGTSEATLQWDALDGEYAVVVANADGSPGVSATVRGAIQVPDLSALGGGLLAASIVFALVALGFILLGGVGLGRRHSGPPPGAGPTGSAPTPLPPVAVGS